MFDMEDTTYLGEVDMRNVDVDLKGSPLKWKTDHLFVTLKLDLGRENLRQFFKRRSRAGKSLTEVEIAKVLTGIL